ncbi:MAG: phosphomannomutase, partial [Gemmatimonadota bacterium]|nr:phosphomannomutase [Gemmatimonadota bacterium]
MRVPRSIFRQYDIRGLVGAELTPEFARALGRAFAAFAGERLGHDAVIAVGRDNRPSGVALTGALRAGMASAGARVIDVGELPTPALYFAVHALQVDAGVQVTGSHNPPEFNGFKMVLEGESVHGDEIQDLYERITLEQAPTRAGTESADGSVLGRYRDAIVERHELARPVKVVVDCGNGVGSVIAVSTLRALGAEVIPIFCESDGTFPNHHPDPTVPANLVDLQVEVRRSGAELGIA